MLHSLSERPSHGFPPLEGCVHVRICVPPPQVLEHTPQSLHTPSIGFGVGEGDGDGDVGVGDGDVGDAVVC